MADERRSLARSFLRSGITGAACAVALAVVGCSYGISVRRAAGDPLFGSLRASLTESDEPSERTRETLHRWDLDALYHREPLAAYVRLQEAAVAEPSADLLFALAEISLLEGRRAEKQGGEACVFYYLCAGYAYHYLFDDGPRDSPFDPRFRIACELYNGGLAKCIRAAQAAGRLDPSHELRLPTPDNQGFTLSVVHHGFPWKPEEFGPLLFCSDYEVVGLENRYRGYGLGVSLVGIRTGRTGTPGAAAPGGAFFPREVSFPVSAFFRFEGTVADLRARRAGRLELYYPLTAQTVEVGGRSVPLETDLTTPLAYFLSRTDLDGVEYAGLLRPDRIRERTGIYMFEPYQPGKIPVVMIHGLLASPLTWTAMFNDLRADPILRERYQFWFYLYPTANTYLEAAADLRKALGSLRAELDPAHRDAELDRMVLVGHSMGGLVSKLLTVDSRDDFWHLVSDQPFEAIKAKPQTRQELRRLFFFERMPGVHRVVFIGTPHHGSKLSPSPPARLVNLLLRLSKDLTQAVGDINEEDPLIGPRLRDGPAGSSLDLLAPGSPALELLASRPRSAGVHFHSIIGDLYGKIPDGGDGIVPYRSAHLEGMDSEMVVAASHSRLHQHPRAVLEVWRILMEHLHEGQPPAGITLAPPRTAYLPPVPGPVVPVALREP